MRTAAAASALGDDAVISIAIAIGVAIGLAVSEGGGQASPSSSRVTG